LKSVFTFLMSLGFVPRKIIIASELLSVEECDLPL